MRIINIKEITKTVKELSIEANYYLPDDIKEAIEKAEKNEKWPIAKTIHRKELLIENTKQRTKKNAVRQTEIFRR